MKKESFIRDSSIDAPTIVEIIRQLAEKLHVSFVEKQGTYYFSLFSKSSNNLKGFPLNYHVGIAIPEHAVGSLPEIRLFCGQYEDDLDRILKLNSIDKREFLREFKAAPFDEALFEHGYSDIHEQEDKAGYAASLPLTRPLIKNGVIAEELAYGCTLYSHVVHYAAKQVKEEKLAATTQKDSHD